MMQVGLIVRSAIRAFVERFMHMGARARVTGCYIPSATSFQDGGFARSTLLLLRKTSVQLIGACCWLRFASQNSLSSVSIARDR